MRDELRSVRDGGQMSGLLQERLELVLSSKDDRVRRLPACETSVTFTITGRPDASVTLFLDRNPPTVVGGAEPAEIAIELTDEQSTQYARGQLSLPATLIGGRVPYRGPVRKYLAVDPIVRALLRALDTGELRG